MTAAAGVARRNLCAARKREHARTGANTAAAQVKSRSNGATARPGWRYAPPAGASRRARQMSAAWRAPPRSRTPRRRGPRFEDSRRAGRRRDARIGSGTDACGNADWAPPGFPVHAPPAPAFPAHAHLRGYRAARLCEAGRRPRFGLSADRKAGARLIGNPPLEAAAPPPDVGPRRRRVDAVDVGAAAEVQGARPGAVERPGRGGCAWK